MNAFHTVPEDIARANQEAEMARREAAKKARLAQREADRKRAEEALLRRKAAEVTVIEEPQVVSAQFKRYSPEEAARLAQAAKTIQAEHRKSEALKARKSLLFWMENERPSLDLIRREFAAALFVHVEDGTYACEGVVIKEDEHHTIAKIKVLSELKGTDVTAKMDALRRHGFVLVETDVRGNGIYRRGEVEVTLFLSAGSTSRTKASDKPKSFNPLSPQEKAVREQRKNANRAARHAAQPAKGPSGGGGKQSAKQSDKKGKKK